MRFHPTITFEQYRDTCQAVAAAKSKVTDKGSWKGYVSMCLVCLALAFAPQLPSARVPALISFAILIFFWIFSKPLARRSRENCLKAIFAEEQEMLNNQVLTVDESGIACDIGRGKAGSHHSWSAFAKRLDLPDAYLFLPTPNSFVRVPKEPLSSSELELIWQWSAKVPTSDGR
jgi:hypothetical protein